MSRAAKKTVAAKPAARRTRSPQTPELPGGLRTLAALHLIYGGMSLVGLAFFAAILLGALDSNVLPRPNAEQTMALLFNSGILGAFQIRWALRLERLEPGTHIRGIAVGAALIALGAFGSPLSIVLGVATLVYLTRPHVEQLVQ